jgi:pSer/pThr/pTyr-binding forkhead associated (FHA) protein
MKIPLAQIEARIQELVEGSATRLFPFGSEAQKLASRMVAAMRENTHSQINGVYWAPNLYLLAVNPEKAAALRENTFLHRELEKLLLNAAEEAGLKFPTPPMIRVIEEPECEIPEMRILTQFNVEHLIKTSVLTLPADLPQNEIPPNAFLIVDGTQVIPLHESVLNIGRSSQNDLVISDPRVSRSHAQIRAINAKFVIFDLDSTGGTLVNNKRVVQQVLHPGDVISLAGMPIIYGQEIPYVAGSTQEIPIEPEDPTSQS